MGENETQSQAFNHISHKLEIWTFYEYWLMNLECDFIHLYIYLFLLNNKPMVFHFVCLLVWNCCSVGRYRVIHSRYHGVNSLSDAMYAYIINYMGIYSLRCHFMIRIKEMTAEKKYKNKIPKRLWILLYIWTLCVGGDYCTKMNGKWSWFTFRFMSLFFLEGLSLRFFSLFLSFFVNAFHSIYKKNRLKTYATP